MQDYCTALRKGLVIDLAARNEIASNFLIKMHGRCGNVLLAREAFERTKERNIFTWTMMIAAYAENGHYTQALQTLHYMTLEGVRPDRVTFITIFTACAGLGDARIGREIETRMRECGIGFDSVLSSALLNMHGKCGTLADAKRVFDSIPGSFNSPVLTTAMLTAYAQLGHPREAVYMFQKMQQEGLPIDKVVLVSILSTCDSLLQGRAIHARALSTGLELDAILGAALVKMYSSLGCIDGAGAVFREMRHRDPVLWNSLISAYAEIGDFPQAVSLFQSMLLEGATPDETSFLILIHSCSHSGRLEQARRLFHEISSDHGASPSEEHFRCMVDLLVRSGKIQTAEELIRSMPFEADVVAWRTLLGGFR